MNGETGFAVLCVVLFVVWVLFVVIDEAGGRMSDPEEIELPELPGVLACARIAEETRLPFLPDSDERGEEQ